MTTKSPKPSNEAQAGQSLAASALFGELAEKQRADQLGINCVQRLVRRQCVTHHHACDCRETRLLSTLKPLAQELLNHGKNGDETAFCAYVDINEMWLELYGCEILGDTRFLPPNVRMSDGGRET